LIVYLNLLLYFKKSFFFCFNRV